MANFTDLPTEMKFGVLGWLRGDDIDAISAASRELWAIATPFRSEHRAFKKQYHTLKTSIYDDPRVPLWTVFKDLYMDLWKISYVKCLCIDGLEVEWEDDDYEEPRHLPYEKADMDLFKRAIVESTFVPGQRKNRWISGVG